MMTAEHYTVAMDLLDDGIDRCAAQLVKYNKGSAYKALLSADRVRRPGAPIGAGTRA